MLSHGNTYLIATDQERPDNNLPVRSWLAPFAKQSQTEPGLLFSLTRGSFNHKRKHCIPNTRLLMSIATRKLQILHILSQNLKNPNPQLVNSNDIANQLNLSLPETHLLLKVLNDMGVIESNVDNQLSLITQKGMHYLEKQTTH